MNLYRCFDTDEETPVQFVGVYITRWRPAWGEPTVMFREAQEDEALAFAAQLPEVRALVEAMRTVEWVQGDDPHNENYDFCPWCQAWAKDGHSADCQRRLALAPFQEAK